MNWTNTAARSPLSIFDAKKFESSCWSNLNDILSSEKDIVMSQSLPIG